MKTIIITFALVATALAGANNHVEFDEDTAGNYNLKYNTDESSRNERRSQDGSVLGSYSFTDPEGKQHTVTYVAAPNQGFVASGASLPVDNNPAPLPVQETPEVLQNRAAHFALVQQESLVPFGSFSHSSRFVEERPVQVHEILTRLTPPQISTDHTDDIESQQAKTVLLAAYREALDRLASEYRRL